MNISTSEYSSGCESGWTMYLEQLSNSGDHHHHHHHHHNNNFVTTICDEEKNDVVVEEEYEYEDEDLSMVSDASSGPPHFQDQYDDQGNTGGVYSQYYGYYTPDQEIKKNKKISSKLIKANKAKLLDTNNVVRGIANNNTRHQNLCLDDTASSPLFDFSQDNVPPSDFSQELSNAHFEGEYSMTKKHFGFFKSSTKGKSSSLLGRKRQ